MTLLSWWKCRIVRNDKIIVEFNKGDIVFAKNGEEMITLFDGKKAVSMPKRHFTKIKLLSRLDKSQTAFVERHYQFKLKQASQSSYQKRICAWCKKVIQHGREPVTHGICPECAQKEMDRYGRQINLRQKV